MQLHHPLIGPNRGFLRTRPHDLCRSTQDVRQARKSRSYSWRIHTLLHALTFPTAYHLTDRDRTPAHRLTASPQTGDRARSERTDDTAGIYLGDCVYAQEQWRQEPVEERKGDGYVGTFG